MRPTYFVFSALLPCALGSVSVECRTFWLGS